VAEGPPFSCGAFPRGGRATLGPWGVSVRVPPCLLCAEGLGFQFGSRPGGPCQGIYVLGEVSVVIQFLVRAPSIGAGHFPPGQNGLLGHSGQGPLVPGRLRKGPPWPPVHGGFWIPVRDPPGRSLPGHLGPGRGVCCGTFPCSGSQHWSRTFPAGPGRLLGGRLGPSLGSGAGRPRLASALLVWGLRVACEAFVWSSAGGRLSIVNKGVRLWGVQLFGGRCRSARHARLRAIRPAPRSACFTHVHFPGCLRFPSALAGAASSSLGRRPGARAGRAGRRLGIVCLTEEPGGAGRIARRLPWRADPQRGASGQGIRPTL
jgi:hypothetical protein